MTAGELAAEIAAEARERAEAFLPPEWVYRDILGWPVEPLTLERFSLLEVLGNAFVTGEPITAESIAQFIWCLDAGFPHQTERRKKLVRWAAKQDYETMLVACRDFLDAQCADLPGNEDSSGVPNAATAAYMVHLLASNYGWPLREIMGLPMQVLIQQVRVIAKASNPKIILFNKRSDAAKSLYLQELRGDKEVGHGA